MNGDEYHSYTSVHLQPQFRPHHPGGVVQLSNIPHDMNKQSSMPSQAVQGMYASVSNSGQLQGTVQPGMSAQGPHGAQAGGLVGQQQSQQMQQRPPASMSPMFQQPRQNHRTMTPMPRAVPNQMQMASNHQQFQPIQMFYPQNFSPYNNQLIISTSPQLSFQPRQIQPFQIPSHLYVHQQPYMYPTALPTGQQSSMYYGPNQNMMRQQTPQPTPTAPAPQRERKIIKITDPKTNEDIDLFGNRPSSTASEEQVMDSETTTPTSSMDSSQSADSHIPSVFAAQVALRASDVGPLKDESPRVPPISSMATNGGGDAELLTANDYCDSEVISSIVHSENEHYSTSRDSIAEEDADSNIRLTVGDKDSLHSSAESVPAVVESSDLNLEKKVTPTSDVETMQLDVADDGSEQVEKHCVSSKPQASINELSEEIVDNVVESNSPYSPESIAQDDNSKVETTAVTDLKTDATVAADARLLSDTLPTEVESSSQLATNGDLAESVNAESKDDGKDKKSKGKKRMRELGKKEIKDGGDMDAFIDPKDEAAPTSNSAVPQSVKLPPTPAIPSIHLPDGDKEISEEEKMVMEKNEENVRVSLEAAKEGTGSGDKEPPLIYSTKSLPPDFKIDEGLLATASGKKQYDRQFLLELKTKGASLIKPIGLPNLEIVKDIPINHTLSDTPRVPASSRNSDMMLPMYARNQTQRMAQMVPRRSQQGRDKSKTKILNLSSSLNKEVQLHEAKNAWKPNAKVEVEENDDPETMELTKKVRGILNKLTPQKFVTLLEQVKELNVDTEERLQRVIDLVLEKAIDEPNYSVPYANMCKSLALIKVPVKGDENKVVNFRKLLLTKCQREFEKDNKDLIKREERLKIIEGAENEEARTKLKAELEDEEMKAKRRSLGNIRFIGELFKLRMLTPPIMHDCIQKLLELRDEESLECLCRLLTTIGKELDTESPPTKPGEPKKELSPKQMMDRYFHQMDSFVKERKVSSRVRFMLQDVMDLRRSNWVPRRDENNPKTLEEIHLEAQKEQEKQAQLLAQQQVTQPIAKRQEKDHRRSRPGNAGHGQDDGWNLVQPKASDIKNLKVLSKMDNKEDIQLGPQRHNISWRKGSSGGNKTNKDELPEHKGNRFSALSNDTSLHEQRLRPTPSRDSSRGRNQQVTPVVGSRDSSQALKEEREKAMAEVRNIVAIGHAETPTPPAKPVETIERAATTTVPSQPSTEYKLQGQVLTEEEIENKVKPLIDEFLSTNDFNEALHCLSEIACSQTIHTVIHYAINHVLERSSQSRCLVGQLLLDLIIKRVASTEDLIKGYSIILESVDDFAIDIPKIWDYLSELISPLVLDSTTSFTFLRDLVKTCMSKDSAKIAAKVVLICASKLGEEKVSELWKASGVSWADFVAPEKVGDFVAQYKLQFTSEQSDASKGELPIELVKSQLDIMLRKKKATNEELMDWIQTNILESKVKEVAFIRALVTSVAENVITEKAGSHEFDEESLKSRIHLLMRYVDHNSELELHVLYALQALVHSLQHPREMLNNIFNLIYDADLISDEAFISWEKSDDPAEQEGKGVALKSVTKFLTWLKEVDKETSDEN